MGKIAASTDSTEHLSRTLSPLMVWGLGVGYVISGMYFGWNLGLAEGGTLGLGIATVFTALMYIFFTLSYAELACAIPKAGGAYTYAAYGLGEQWGILAGLAQIIEFVFAPPAIAAAIGAYLHIFFPSVPTLFFACAAYVVFTAINIRGVKVAASLELIITIIAIVELIIFAGLTIPHFNWAQFSHNPLPNSYSGIFAAIPFSIWFFLAIEGIANLGEEAINPQRGLMLGFSYAMVTLVILCFLTFFASIGVGGWEKIVYVDGASTPSDSPLPLALGQVLGSDSPFYHLLVVIGVFGLVASFNGIIEVNPFVQTKINLV